MEEEVVEFFAFCILKGRQVLAVLVFSREMSAQFLCRPPRCLTQAAQRAAFIFQIGMKCLLFLRISMFIFCTKYQHIANNFQNKIEQRYCNPQETNVAKQGIMTRRQTNRGFLSHTQIFYEDNHPVISQSYHCVDLSCTLEFLRKSSIHNFIKQEPINVVFIQNQAFPVSIFLRGRTDSDRPDPSLGT